MVMVLTAARGIFERHRDMSGLAQVRAQERDLKQAFFREKTKLCRDVAEHRQAYPYSSGDSSRRGSCRVRSIFSRPSTVTRTPAIHRSERAHTRPTRIDDVAGFVDQRQRDADAAAEERGQNEQRVDYDQAPEKGHEFLL